MPNGKESAEQIDCSSHWRTVLWRLFIPFWLSWLSTCSLVWTLTVLKQQLKNRFSLTVSHDAPVADAHRSALNYLQLLQNDKKVRVTKWPDDFFLNFSFSTALQLWYLVNKIPAIIISRASSCIFYRKNCVDTFCNIEFHEARWI